jgi:hypothetical protein
MKINKSGLRVGTVRVLDLDRVHHSGHGLRLAVNASGAGKGLYTNFGA